MLRVSIAIRGKATIAPGGTKTVILSQAYLSTPLAQKDLRASSTQTLCPTEDKAAWLGHLRVSQQPWERRIGGRQRTSS